MPRWTVRGRVREHFGAEFSGLKGGDRHVVRSLVVRGRTGGNGGGGGGGGDGDGGGETHPGVTTSG